MPSSTRPQCSAIDLLHVRQAHEPHRYLQFVFQDLHDTRDAGRSGDCQPIAVRTPDQHGMRILTRSPHVSNLRELRFFIDDIEDAAWEELADSPGLAGEARTAIEGRVLDASHERPCTAGTTVAVRVQVHEPFTDILTPPGAERVRVWLSWRQKRPRSDPHIRPLSDGLLVPGRPAPNDRPACGPPRQWQ